MDSNMTPMTPDMTPLTPETPAALKLLATNLAGQVELGIVIERAMFDEQRAHGNTRRQLSHCRQDRDRLMESARCWRRREEDVRRAMVGEADPTPGGDVLAEARELWAKAYNLEAELLRAKALLESAHAQPGDWESERSEWADRVSEIMGMTRQEPIDPEMEIAGLKQQIKANGLTPGVAPVAENQTDDEDVVGRAFQHYRELYAKAYDQEDKGEPQS